MRRVSFTGSFDAETVRPQPGNRDCRQPVTAVDVVTTVPVVDNSDSLKMRQKPSGTRRKRRTPLANGPDAASQGRPCRTRPGWLAQSRKAVVRGAGEIRQVLTLAYAPQAALIALATSVSASLPRGLRPHTPGASADSLRAPRAGAGGVGA